MLWDPQYAGKIGVLDDSGEALTMAMLAWDITDDVNTGDPEHHGNAAKDKLIELIDRSTSRSTSRSTRPSPTGKFTVHQAWSGDLIAARWYLPKGESARGARLLGAGVDVSERVIGNDCIAIPKSSPSPVLAHTFLNYILDNDVAEKNFNWNGYQPPLTKLDAQYLIDKGYIVENLMSAVVVPEDFPSGISPDEQTPAVAEPVAAGVPGVPELAAAEHGGTGRTRRRASSGPPSRFRAPPG